MVAEERGGEERQARRPHAENQFAHTPSVGEEVKAHITKGNVENANLHHASMAHTTSEVDRLRADVLPLIKKGFGKKVIAIEGPWYMET